MSFNREKRQRVSSTRVRVCGIVNLRLNCRQEIYIQKKSKNVSMSDKQQITPH